MRRYTLIVGLYLILSLLVPGYAHALVQGEPARLPEEHVLQPAPSGVKPNIGNNINQSSGNDAVIEQNTTQQVSRDPEIVNDTASVTPDASGPQEAESPRIIGKIFLGVLCMFVIWGVVYFIMKKYGPKK